MITSAWHWPVVLLFANRRSGPASLPLLTYRPDYFGKGSNRIVRGIFNGWAISPIIKMRSGLPFTVVNGVDANLDGVSTDRAQLIGDPHLANPTAAMWFNTAAFAQNKVVTGVIPMATRPVTSSMVRATTRLILRSLASLVLPSAASLSRSVVMPRTYSTIQISTLRAISQSLLRAQCRRPLA